MDVLRWTVVGPFEDLKAVIWKRAAFQSQTFAFYSAVVFSPEQDLSFSRPVYCGVRETWGVSSVSNRCRPTGYF